MLTNDNEVAYVNFEREKNLIRMRELDLFSEQLGNIAAVSAFMGCNGWFGVMEFVEITDSTPSIIVFYNWVYFVCSSLGFLCTMYTTVCSTFVMIWGTEKALRGRKENIEKTITKMYGK